MLIDLDGDDLGELRVNQQSWGIGNVIDRAGEPFKVVKVIEPHLPFEDTGEYRVTLMLEPSV